MFKRILLSAAVLAATIAAPAGAAVVDRDLSQPDMVRRASPLPAGTCVTAGEVGIPYRTGVNCRTVEVDGHPRRFVVYVPRQRPVTGPLRPVVFMFHGTSGTGEQFLRSSGWREQADATGLVAVFPTGLRYRVNESGRLVTKWHAFGLEEKVSLEEKPAGYPEGAPWPADDVGLTDRIMRDLGRRLPIDPRRVYASGFSNGAEFAARLAVERADLLAAAAFSAGALPEAKPTSRPVPTWVTAGALDDRILEQTGPPPLTELPLDPVALLSEPVVDARLDAHLGTLGLDEGLFGTLAVPGSTAFRWPAIGSGPGGGLFRFTLLGGMGHVYPHAGNNDPAFEAAPEFWEFFRTHRLP